MSQRILLVDDDKDHAESVADVLQGRGYEVEVAYSGEQALARFIEVDFDVTLMDVRMPGMNGVETFFHFRKLRPDAKVIMMTGFSVDELLRQATEGGAVGVLHKPFLISELLSLLSEAKSRDLVLVADDDRIFTNSVADLLKLHGYLVDIARTGVEALAQLEANRVDCLILDLELPILSGLEVYRALRQRGCAFPIILVAPHPLEACDRWVEAHQQILFKPFDPALLLEAVDRALNTRARVAA
jgi:two-component system, NtrC family, response regulator HydG